MKNKRNVLIAFILVCCLCLSIGYAALADDLYIDGSASVTVLSNDPDDSNDTETEKEFKEDVYFVNFGATQNPDANYVIVNSAKDADDTDTKPDALTVTIPGDVLSPENPTIVLNAAIKNDSTDYGASVTLPAGGKTTGKNFSYAITWADDDTITEKTIAVGAEPMPIKITITLLTTPTEDIPSESFDVSFNATAVATVNPTT